MSKAACAAFGEAAAQSPTPPGSAPGQLGGRRASCGRAGDRRQSQPRSESRDRRRAAGRRRARAFARQSGLERLHDQRAHQAGIAKAHFGLGRMHIDVDLARGKRDEQSQKRMAVARQIIGVGAAHRADQELVAHRAGR